MLPHVFSAATTSNRAPAVVDVERVDEHDVPTTLVTVAIPAHAGYNYLVSRVNSIVLDMERAAPEIVNIVTDNSIAKTA